MKPALLFALATIVLAGCSSDNRTALESVIADATATGQLIPQDAIPGSRLHDGKAFVVQTVERSYAALGLSDMVQVNDNNNVTCIVQQSNPTDQTPVFAIRVSACPDPLGPATDTPESGNPSDKYVDTVVLRYTQRTNGELTVPLDESLLDAIATELTEEGREIEIAVRSATAFELVAENATSCWTTDGTNSSAQSGPCP